MKFISWNVNGIRACVQKGFMDVFNELDADIFCIQESKMQAGQLELDMPGYHQYWNYAEKKGYSGTGIFTKKEPVSVSYGLGIEEHDKEGRVITLAIACASGVKLGLSDNKNGVIYSSIRFFMNIVPCTLQRTLTTINTTTLMQ